MYTLEGRAMKGDSLKGPCIFCGKVIEHINEGGVGWLIGSVINGETEYFLHCHDRPCPEFKAAVAAEPPFGPIWRCGCSPDYVESVGDVCQHCRRPRTDPHPYPCGRCDESITDATAKAHYEACRR